MTGTGKVWYLAIGGNHLGAMEMEAVIKRVMLAGLALCAAPALAVTPIEVAVGVGARAAVGSDESVGTDQIFNSWSGSGPGTLALAMNVAAGDEYTVSAVVGVEAVWETSERGTVAIDWGRVFGGTPPDPPIEFFAGTNNAPEILFYPANWYYSFTATENGFFQVTYEITTRGYTFGLQPIYLFSLGSSLVSLGGTFDDPAGAGTYAMPLVAGETYSILMFNLGNLFAGSVFDRTGSASARIAWEITRGGGVVPGPGVPEPGMWALLIAGFGMVGAALRRREVATPA